VEKTIRFVIWKECERAQFFVTLQSFRNQSTLLLSLFSFLSGQPKSYRTIDLVRLPYLRKWDVILLFTRVLPNEEPSLCFLFYSFQHSFFLLISTLLLMEALL